MNAICLVMDRLHGGLVGAYGNTWIRTPALDRLAAEGFVCDQVFIESPELERLYEGYWLGRHAMGPPTPGDASESLPALLSAQSSHTMLLTDDPHVAGHRLSGSFQEIVELDLPESCAPAQKVDQTQLARCFAQAVELIETAREPFLLLCHFRSLGTVWDAPAEFRLAYREQGDPEPSATAQVPDLVLPADYDPDELLAWSMAYAGQVSLLDACMAALRECLLTTAAGQRTLLAVTSARGFPLGEHRRVGVCDEALYGELVQVPLLLRFPDGQGAADRTPSLVQPSDLWPTLLEWLGVPPATPTPPAQSLMPLVRGERDALRDRVGIRGHEAERAMVTAAWYLRHASKAELYLRPDDRWQANDVANRCPDTAHALDCVLSQYEEALQSSQASCLPPLDPSLASGPE